MTEIEPPSGSPGRYPWGPQVNAEQRWVDSLRVRLSLPFLLLSVLVLLVLTLVIGQGAERLYVDRLREELIDQANLAAFSVSREEQAEPGAREVADLIDSLAVLGNSRMTLIAADGTVLADSAADPSFMKNHNSRPEVMQAREHGVGSSRHESDAVDDSFLYVAVTVPNSDGEVLRSAVSLDRVDDAVGSAQRIIMIAALLLILLFAGASWILSGRLVQPLERLRRQANRVATGDLTGRVASTQILEIDAVGDSFNLMTAALEESLEAQERSGLRLEAIMSGLADGVVLTDDSGQVLRLNQTAAEMFDVAEEGAVTGQPFLQVARDHEVWDVLRTALQNNTMPSVTVAYGLRRISLQVSARTVAGANERLGLVVLRDVSDLHRLENVRREFVANVSHELRTPLTSIRALVETLESGVVNDPDVVRDFLGRIVGEVERLNALVEDLLDFARLEAGRSPLETENVDIGEVVRKGAERLAPQIDRAGLTLSIDISPDLPEIAIDIKRVEQVLLNLIHNAIKFTPSGGRIDIRVGRDGSMILVKVSDTGVGIDPGEQGRLFERFYKSDRARRSEGTGLGLAIAKHIVQLHGGDISVESVPAQGSSFVFTLPVSGKKARHRARRRVAGLL